MKKILLIIGITVAICFSSNGQGKIQIPQVQGLNTALNNKESWLDNPSTNGYVLSSTVSGIRSWIPATGGTYLNGTGFVKASGTTITYDASTYLDQTASDARYNLVANNINPYNYFVPLDTTQTNDATNSYIYGNLHITGGGDLLTAGRLEGINIVQDDNTGYISIDNAFVVRSGALNTYLETTKFLYGYSFSTAYPDTTPIIRQTYGDNDHNAVYICGKFAQRLDDYTIGTSGFHITDQSYIDGATIKTIGMFSIDHNNTNIFNIDNTGQVEATSFKLKTLNTAPTSSTDAGTVGEIRYDTNYMYVCIATNAWKRSPLTTW